MPGTEKMEKEKRSLKLVEDSFRKQQLWVNTQKLGVTRMAYR